MSTDPTTILDPIRANAERDPDRLLFAFLDSDGRTAESYTYEAFLRRADAVAAHFHETLPLEPGERVLLVYPPGLEMIVALFACTRLGLIPVPVYPPASHGFAAALHKMDFIARDCTAAAVLTDRSYYWSLRLQRARANLTAFSLRRDYTSRLTWVVTVDADSNRSAAFPEAHSDILFLQYTSGSTHDPRGVMVTHRNVLSNCDAVVDHTPVTVSWLPQYHDMGLIAFYLFMPIKGATNYGLSPVDFIRRPLVWLEAMTRHRATASAAPNFAYEYCLRPDKVGEEDLQHLDLSPLRTLLNGAEPVKASVFRGFVQRFSACGLDPASFSTAYGLAEYTLAVAGRGRAIRTFDALQLTEHRAEPALPSREPDDTKSLVSCGPPLGATELEIVDGSSRAVPDGHVGEVWVAGPSKCRGYWGRPELSEKTFEARLDGDRVPGRGWLRTGDLGFIHQRELFICGRAKDVIIVRGANYYPQDIEAIVEADPAVRTGCVAAFSNDDQSHGAIIVVAELRSRSRTPDAHALNRRVHERLGISVDLFLFIPKRTIPKTSSGKISRHRAHAQWRDDAFEVVQRVETSPASGPRDPEAWGAAEHDLDAQLAELFEGNGLTGSESHPLADAGLDSIALVDFALDLERYLEARGAGELAAGIQVQWLQKIPVCELFEVVRDIRDAAPHAKLRFRQAFSRLRREHLEVERRLMRADARLPADWRCSPEPGTRPAAGGSTLLTAATGFFGPFLLRSLLEQSVDPIRVLVRARDARHGLERIQQGLAAVRDPAAGPDGEAWSDRIIPVCADLQRPGFGLSPAQWSTLCDEVHTIYHNGALVNYLLDYSSMRATNVGSTCEVIRLAATGRSKILNHVSTTFVFGWSTKGTLFETDTNPNMELLDFGYSQSKWVSEQLVLEAIRRGLPARVFRPALISPSVDGRGNNFDIAIRLLAFMLHHGITATARNQVSLMPADVTANNIVAIANLPDTVGATFHVTRDVYASLMDVTAILGELTGTTFTGYPVDAFVQLMIERCQKDDLLFPLVNFFVHSADNITAMEFKRYDSRDYQAARARSAFGAPDPPLDDVVRGILRFMVRHGLVDAPSADLVGTGS
jgi:thioester reductase-like protein